MFGSAPTDLVLYQAADEWQPTTRRRAVGYLYGPLCSMHLPRKQVHLGPNEDHVLRFGQFSLVLQPGYLDLGEGPEKQPLPYGSVARQLMLAINRRALAVAKSPLVDLGSGPRSLLREMGHDSGGRRYERLQASLRGLIAMHMTATEGGGGVKNLRIISDADAWKSSPKGRWCQQLLLSDEYWCALCESAVPLDLDAINMIRGSPLAIDIYIWLCVRLRTIVGPPVFLNWHVLKRQFGPDYLNMRDFRHDFQKRFGQAVAAYRPSPRVELLPTGVNLWRSPSPVPPLKLGKSL